MCKTQFILKSSRCFTKETVIFFLLWITLYIYFLIAYSPILVFYFDLLVFTQSVCVKVFFVCFMKLLPYSIFTMYCVLILGFLFSFVVTYPKCMCKCLGILGAPRKKHRCYFLLGVPCAYHFDTIKCRDS